MDLPTPETFEIPSQGRFTVDTGLQFLFPHHTYGQLHPRSGLATFNHISVAGGVLDRAYRGTVKITLFNHGNVRFIARRGDRICQLLVHPAIIVPTREIREYPVSERFTSRQANGLGSTDGHSWPKPGLVQACEGIQAQSEFSHAKCGTLNVQT